MQNRHIQKTKKIISLTLCFLFMLLVVLSADVVNDYQDHYAKESIKELFEKGVITGYEDGSFKPDREISRAEFMTIINRAFSFKEQAEISFTDVVKGQWHYEQIAVAVKAGYIKGFTDGTMRPTANITRQEAAVIIARILDIEKDGDIKKLTTLKDGDKVPQWSAQGVAAIVERDYIDLKEDNKFLAAQNLTRADMAIAIVRSQKDAIAKLYNKSGTYTGGKIDGNVKIDNKGITLKDTEINGDLILGEGIKDGDVHLINVIAKGNTIVKGGGRNTITLENCQFEKIIILKEDGKVRILAKGNTKIKQSEVKSGAILESQGKAGEGFGYITIAEDISEDSIVELIGDFKTIEIKGSGVDIQASGGTIENLIVAKGTKDIEIDLAKDTKVAALIVDSPAKITGTGKIDKATVNAQGVKIEATVTKIETAPGIEVDMPKKETTPTTGGGGGGGGGSKGSGGTSTPAKTEVDTINVIGEGGVTEITTDGGSLQMIATVTPSNASNKNVTWYVNDTNIATIDSNGKLTAKANGTIKVTAKAKDGSGKSGYVEITISNQTVTPPLSDAKAMTSFKFESLSPVVTGVIDETAKTIILTVPYATNVTALVPTIIHTGDSISPADGSRDFTNPVIYTVTAENNSTVKYTITVNIAPTGSHILTYIAGTGGTITGTSPQTVADGEDGTTVTAVPNEGYLFAQWSDGVLTAERTDTNVIASETYTANFEPDTIEVGFESLTANGTSGTTTTTVLDIKFDQEIPSLSSENIALEGATLKLLTMSSTSNECSITIENIKVKNGENVRVIIDKKGYLFTPTSKEVEVYVANIQAEINPTLVTFDKKNPKDIETTISFGTATKVESIKKGETALKEGTDYTIIGETLTIKNEYLSTQLKGSIKLDITFNQGYERTLTINISNDVTYSIVVEEIIGGFGMEIVKAYKGYTQAEEAQEGEHVTISIENYADLKAWKVKSAKIFDSEGKETDIKNSNVKYQHSFTMPASDIIVKIVLEPEEDSTRPTADNKNITAARITDIGLKLNWEKSNDNLTPQNYLRYYVYQSKFNNIDTVENIEKNRTLLNDDGTYNLQYLDVSGLDPDTNYYFNIVVSDYAGNKVAYTMKEIKTQKAVTDLDLTSKVTKPVKYEKINNKFVDGDEYSATSDGANITWYKKDGDKETQVFGEFESDTVYIAKVALTAKEGYSFNHSTEFNYDDATVSFDVDNNDPKKGNLTITFPATEAITKYALTLDGDGLTSNPPEGLIDENTKVTVTVIPYDGEQLKTFTVNGENKQAELTDNKYTFTITEDTTIVVTYTDEYTLTSSGNGVVEFKVSDSIVNIAKKGNQVTMIVTYTQEGQELIGVELVGIKKADVNEIKIGEEFTFIMPNNDVSVSVTVGEPKKLDIDLGVTTQTSLINGILEKFTNLTWSYFTNTLTLNNYKGNHLGVPSGEIYQLDLELKGTSEITNNIHVTPGLKFRNQVTIEGDGTLKISNSFNSDTTVVSGIYFQSNNNQIKLKDGATIDVIVEAKGSKGVDISNIMPSIGNGVAAYKGTAVWSAGDGDSDEKPIEITYHVAKGTELKGSNICAGKDTQITDIKTGGFDGTTINAVDTINFDEKNQTIVYAKHNEKYYKIIIKEDTPIADFQNTKVTDTTASFSWTAAIDATGVKIQKSLQGENSWIDAATKAALTPESTSAIVTGLTPSTAYDFKLVVTGGENQGDTEAIAVKTLEETDDQKAVNAEAEKYKAIAEIAKDVGVGVDVTSTVVKLLEGETADGGIDLSYAISSSGTYLEINGNAIKLKDQKISEGDATETVTITFKKGDETATKNVTVTIKSSNKKMIKIAGTEYDLNSEVSLPEGLSWDDETKILTMGSYNGGAIHTNFEAGYNLAKLEVNGTNTITVNDDESTATVIALGTKTALTISGSGTLMIDVKTEKSSEVIGIYDGFYVDDKTKGTGSYGMSSISIASGVILNIDVESQTGPSSAIKASTLTLNGGIVNFASKSNSGNANGIDVVNFNYNSGSVTTIGEGVVTEGNSGDPVFSRETPYVSNKATKITNLTWDSKKNATEEDKAVEYTIQLKSDTAELTVNDIAVVLNESMTLEVFSDEEFNTEWQGVVFNEEKTQDTVYVRAKRTVSGKTTTRYFIINLIKE